jgi:hypothetical protein
MDGMVVAVTRQCESRRQRAEHAGTTNQPWGSETSTILRRHHIHCTVLIDSARVPLHVLATSVPAYTAYHTQ